MPTHVDRQMRLREFIRAVKATMRRAAGAGGGALFIFATSCTAWSSAHLPGPAVVAAKVQNNVIYGQSDGVKLKLDFYFPAASASKSRPVVLYVHGGGWQMGDKSMLSQMPGPTELLRRGYVVASIDYRLAPKYTFPAMLEDAKCAVRFLRAHADQFELDPKRIGVMGDSAGGHLAALLGLTAATTEFDGDGGWSAESSRVGAVVDFYGPSDFTMTGIKADKPTISLLKTGFGASSADDPILRRASPVTYVSAAAPPFLILHGDRDHRVEMKQSVELNQRLEAAGVSSTLVVITNFSHGYTPLGLKSSPTHEEISKMVADFFDHNLR